MSRMRSPVVLILAIASGGIAFLFSMNALKPAPKNQVALQVVGLVRDLEIGSLIKREDLDLFPAPKDINPKVLFTDFEAVTGKVNRRNLAKGSVIKTVDLVEHGDNLASLIPEGHRAMTISVSVPSKTANFLQVGNRVDILLTYPEKENEFKTVTLAKSARVIGVSEPTDKGMGDFNKEMSITLAVTPTGAETLSYGMKKGPLNVTVYSLSETTEKQPEKFFTIGELFEKKEDRPRPQVQAAAPVFNSKPMISIEVIRGIQKADFFFDSSNDSQSAQEGEK